MRAEEARKRTQQSSRIKEFIEYTENNILRATERGERHAVMQHPDSLKYELAKYWKSQGYEVKQLFPPQLTLYVVW